MQYLLDTMPSFLNNKCLPLIIFHCFVSCDIVLFFTVVCFSMVIVIFFAATFVGSCHLHGGQVPTSQDIISLHVVSF